MTNPNPFAAPQQQVPQQQAPANPFAQQQAPQQQAPAAPANPFGAGVATAPAAPQQQTPAGNPFAAAQQAPAPAPAPAAPQAYAGPQQQYAAPAAPQAPQQWQQAPAAAPAQQWQAPAAPQQQAQYAAPPALDPAALNAAPAPSSGGAQGAKLPDMYGRLALFFPQSLARVPRNPQHITPEQRAAGNVEQDRLTATVVVLDSGPGTRPGGTIEWGGNPHALGGSPHTNSDPLPYVRKSMWINQTRLIEQLRAYLPAPGGVPGMVVGRISKNGPANNDPWYLAPASPDEIALAQTYLGLVGQGAYPHPLA